MVDLVARHQRVQAAVEAAVVEVLRSGRYIGGPVEQRALAALARRHGVRHAVGAASGTAALRLLLQAGGVGPGVHVVVPALTFFATVESVVQTGATPVLADVDPHTGLLDPDDCRAALEEAPAGPLAVVPVWLFGNRPQVTQLGGIPVFHDAAQAVGQDLSGCHAALSLYPTKVLGAAGDGGAVLTSNDDLAEAARQLGCHTLVGPHLHGAGRAHIGDNNRVGALQAAVVQAHLSDLDRRLARRRAIAAAYRAALGHLASVPHDPSSPVSVWSLLHPRRDALRQALQSSGIDTAVYYPRPLGDQPALQGRAVMRPTPIAARLCRELLALPCHAELSDAQVDHVIAAVRRHA